MEDDLTRTLRSEPMLWDLFTRKEEYDPGGRDEHGRFLHTASKHGDPVEPRVSEFLFGKGFRPEHPDGKSFAVFLSHDVDLLKPMSLSWLRLPRIGKKVLKSVSRKFRTAWAFDDTLRLEERYGAHSTFFLMALEKGDEEFDYRLSELSEETSMILDKGFEVGLHGGLSAFRDKVALATEKERMEKILGRKVVGFRNHYLKIEVPLTWHLLSEAGFAYDSTLGYAETIGFRNGMCHPFRPFDLNTNEYVDILEIPLGLMDGSIYSYMKLDSAGGWERTRPMIDRVAECGGVLTVLWHNTYMAGDPLAFYERLLKYCAGKGGWFASGAEIAKWWAESGLARMGATR